MLPFEQKGNEGTNAIKLIEKLVIAINLKKNLLFWVPK
jgi:hypothetical protein